MNEHKHVTNLKCGERNREGETKWKRSETARIEEEKEEEEEEEEEEKEEEEKEEENDV